MKEAMPSFVQENVFFDSLFHLPFGSCFRLLLVTQIDEMENHEKSRTIRIRAKEKEEKGERRDMAALRLLHSDLVG